MGFNSGFKGLNSRFPLNKDSNSRLFQERTFTQLKDKHIIAEYTGCVFCVLQSPENSMPRTLRPWVWIFWSTKTRLLSQPNKLYLFRRKSPCPFQEFYPAWTPLPFPHHQNAANVLVRPLSRKGNVLGPFYKGFMPINGQVKLSGRASDLRSVCGLSDCLPEPD